ncbi:hypothetical protein LCGC14_1777490, partial [marine sediment metagenome]
IMGVAIVGALTLTGCVTYRNLNLLKNPIVPKEFKNYREKGNKVEETDFMYFGFIRFFLFFKLSKISPDRVLIPVFIQLLRYSCLSL